MQISFIQDEEAVPEKEGTAERILKTIGFKELEPGNDELRKCGLAATVPLQISYPTQNLAQAVMFSACELSKIAYNRNIPEVRQQESFPLVKEKTDRVLQKACFLENTIMYSRFKERLNFLSTHHIHLIHSVTKKNSGKRKIISYRMQHQNFDIVIHSEK